MEQLQSETPSPEQQSIGDKALSRSDGPQVDSLPRELTFLRGPSGARVAASPLPLSRESTRLSPYMHTAKQSSLTSGSDKARRDCIDAIPMRHSTKAVRDIDILL